MEIRPTNVHSGQNRSRSRSRTRNSSSRSNSTRRPSLSGKRSLSSSSLNRLSITSTSIDNDVSFPTANVILDNSLPLDFFKLDILSLTKALRISKWHKRQLNPSNLIVNRISGALTNSIYKIEYKDSEQNLILPSLLLRIFGKNVDSIIDREAELKTLIKLSQKKIGPKLLGNFTNGRFEQFLEGYLPLDKEVIRNEVISQMIGRRMKDLHSKIALEPEDAIDSLPMSWKLIFKWLEIIEKEYLPCYAKEGIDEKEIFLVDFKKFKELILSYKEWLFDKYEGGSLLPNFKFCHNDTQYGNLLLHESFDPLDIVVDTNNDDEALISTINRKDFNLVVIDFEYSGCNLPAYDLVNHFSEWMADYHDEEKSYFIHDDKYPNQLQILNLIKSYVEYEFTYPSSNLVVSSSPDINNTKASELIQFEIRKLYNECILWRPTVQIYWCLWGLIQNGPPKSSQFSELTSEQGINSTYNIVTSGIENLQIDENAIEDNVTSSDDDFDYFKYIQQKSGCFMADFINFGFIKKDDIEEKYWDILKFLDTKLLDL